ncbi:MAG: RAMP superfamily CRISPR-associated protein [Thermodesulfobacteriota bacterium]|nr:RAMP superfamily CRISPR-associated protein [Thermodesulfobacteriota bacterium]
MSFDYYATLAENKACPKQGNEGGLASGFMDGCAVWSCQDKPQDKEAKEASDLKNEARQCYMKRAAELKEENFKFPKDVEGQTKKFFRFPDYFEPDFSNLLDSTWFGIDVSFTLVSPWYSKDDRPFHVLDNPVRKDRVFGVPFMSVASWKGLLRWAYAMKNGLVGPYPESDQEIIKSKKKEIVHLFGNEKVEQKDFRSGAVVFYPTWFNKVGFEVINPHSRSRRAGTQPIYYEVVPAGTKGRLRLLYAPLPGEIENDKVTPADFINSFIDSIRAILETYGISAKRTAGWGTAQINEKESKLYFVEGGCLSNLISDVAETKQYEPPKEEFKKLMDEEGNPISCLLTENGKLLSKTQFKKLTGEKPCTNREFDEFRKWYEDHGSEYRKHLKANKEDTPSLLTRELSFDKLIDAVKRLRDNRKGGDQ